jgi:hypothetical protein
MRLSQWMLAQQTMMFTTWELDRYPCLLDPPRKEDTTYLILRKGRTALSSGVIPDIGKLMFEIRMQVDFMEHLLRPSRLPDLFYDLCASFPELPIGAHKTE